MCPKVGPQNLMFVFSGFLEADIEILTRTAFNQNSTHNLENYPLINIHSLCQRGYEEKSSHKYTRSANKDCFFIGMRSALILIEFEK
jgi:hypothetical protein